jgi:hypothetical protein
MKAQSPHKQLDGFLAKFTPEIAALARAALAKMQQILPNAILMVYDNFYALVIGFVPNERPSDAVFSLAIYPKWVTLCFLQGVGIPDPDRLLQGSGRQVRHLRLPDADALDSPEIRTLIEAALRRARVPFDPDTESRLIIRSVSEAQRPRRPPAKRGHAKS